MKQETSSRWAISFADLIMLLLAFFVMLQAQSADRMKMMAGIRNAFGGEAGVGDRVEGFAAAGLFESGEAILKPAEPARFARIGAEAARAQQRIAITATGRDAGSARLDSWELAAARTAAIARAVRGGGMPENRIEIAIPTPRPGDPKTGLRIEIRRFAR